MTPPRSAAAHARHRRGSRRLRGKALGLATWLAGVGTALGAGQAHAGGFLIYEQGTRALGQGGAFVGRADDPSALFYNPAGIAAHRRLAAQVGATLLVGSTHASIPPASVDAETEVTLPPHIYATVPLPRDLAVGLGIFVPYGLRMDWPAGWPGRHRILSAKAQSAAFNPTVAWRAHPRLSVGAGFSIVRAGFELERSLNLVQSEGHVHLGGSDTTFGANVGLLVDVVPERLSAGLAFRSAADMHVRGDANFTVPPEWDATFRDQGVAADVATPHLLALGLSFRAVPSLRLGLDTIYATWSRFSELRFDFDDDSLDATELQDWSDSLAVRLGAEWQRARWRARAGLGYESSPVPTETLSPLVPDAGRAMLSVGGGVDLGPATLDVAYMLSIFGGRDSTLPGFPAHYQSSAHFVGLGVTVARP